MRLALYQPDIPQNVGAAIRASFCLGARLDVIEPCGFPLDSREVRRVAMDYGETAVPTAHASWAHFQESVGKARIILMTTKTESSIWDCRFRPDDIILMGRESAGAPEEVHARADERLRIPIAPKARSLNVVVAAAITLAEAARQMRTQSTSP